MAAVKDSITGLYITYFNRAPDKAGLDYWLAQAAAQGDTAALFGISSAFAQNSVAVANYPSSLSNTAFVEQVYLYALNRTPAQIDSNGKAFWLGRLTQGVSRSDFMVEFINATLDYNPSTDTTSTAAQKQSAIDAQNMIKNKITAGIVFAASDKSNVVLDGNGNPDTTAASYVASRDVMSGVTQDSNTLTTAINKASGYANTLPTSAYSVFAQQTSANEGTAATFKLNTTNVANGTVVNYTLSGTGITAADVTGGLSGTATVQNNTATITVNLAADATTEGNETISVAITGQTLGSSSVVTTVITDTSTTPAGSAFTLTTGTDALVGTAGDDTFTGTAATTNPTLNVSDTINGGAGTNDTFNLAIDVLGANSVPAATTTAVENINVRNVSGNDQTITGGNFTGATAFVSDRSTNKLIVNGLAAGQSVGANGNSAITNGALDFAYTNGTTPVVLNIANGTVGTAAITNTGAGTTTNTINSTGAINSVGIVDLGTATNVTTLNIAAATGLTATLAADYAANSTINISGAAVNSTAADGSALAAVNLSGATLSTAITSVNASGLTAGGASVVLGANTTAFTGGAGNDTVAVNALVFNGTATVAAGAGTGDTLVLTDQAALTSVTAPKLTGFEVLSLADDNDGALDTFDISLLSGITSLRLAADSAGDGYTINNMNATQAGAVTISGSQVVTPTFGVSGANTVGQLDTLSITASDGLTAASTITVANLTASGVETVNINAVDNFTATVLTGLTAVTNVNVSGGGNVSLTTGALAANVNTVINAAAVTGTVTIDATAATTNGVSVIGTSSSSANTLTGSAQNDNITGGAGNDALSGLAGNDVITAGTGNDSIVGGAGADTINVGTGTDRLQYGAAADTFNATVTSGTTVLNGIDVISGMGSGDSIQLFGALAGAIDMTAATTISSSIITAGTADAIGIIRGTLNTSTNIWTTSTSGSDLLVQWDSNGTTAAGTIESIVLVGNASTAAVMGTDLITFS